MTILRIMLVLLMIVGVAEGTVNEVTARNDYTGNGTTTVFTYTFKILTKTDIEVLKDGVVQTVDTHYSVSGLGASGGGSVTFTVAPASATKITLLRKQPASQLSTYTPNEAFPATRIERDLDKLQMQVQQLQEQLNRSLKYTKKSTLTNPIMPDGVVDKFLQWKSATELQNTSVVSAGSIGIPVTGADGGTGTSNVEFRIENVADCTLITSPIAGKTKCFNTTNGVLYNYDGTGWQSDAALATKIFNPLDPRWGCVGNGVTDDAACLALVMGAINTAGGGALYLPCNTSFLIQARVRVYSKTHVFGCGPSSIIKIGVNIDPNNGQAFYTATGVTTSDLIFENFAIDGNKANVALAGVPNDAKQSALHLNQVSNVIVRGLYIHDSVESCIYIQNSPSLVLVDGNRLEGCGKTGAGAGHGISFGVSPTFFRVVNNYITGALRAGVSVVAEGGLHADTFVIANNIVRNSEQDGILLGDSGIADGLIDHYIRNGTISGNTVQGNARYGIALSENSTIITGKTGIIQDIAIVGNTVQGNTQHGIALLVTNDGLIRRVLVSGNTSQDNATYGLAVNAAGVSDTLVTGNVFTGNTAAAILNSGTRTILGINKTDITSTLVFPTGFQTSPLTANAVYNDQIAKSGARFRGSDGADQGSFNVTSISRSSVGVYVVTWGTDCVDTNYQTFVTPLAGSGTAIIGWVTTQNAGDITIETRDHANILVDPTAVSVIAFCRQ